MGKSMVFSNYDKVDDKYKIIKHLATPSNRTNEQIKYEKQDKNEKLIKEYIKILGEEKYNEWIQLKEDKNRYEKANKLMNNKHKDNIKKKIESNKKVIIECSKKIEEINKLLGIIKAPKCDNLINNVCKTKTSEYNKNANIKKRENNKKILGEDNYKKLAALRKKRVRWKKQNKDISDLNSEIEDIYHYIKNIKNNIDDTDVLELPQKKLPIVTYSSEELRNYNNANKCKQRKNDRLLFGDKHKILEALKSKQRLWKKQNKDTTNINNEINILHTELINLRKKNK